jgi:hypothetical protein
MRKDWTRADKIICIGLAAANVGLLVLIFYLVATA